MKRLTLCVLLVLAAGMALASTAAKDLYIPAVARSTGAFGTFWSSDVRLYNPTTAAVTATIAYLPSAAYAGDATSGTVDLGPLETVLLENVLETKLGIVTNTAGALHITAPENIYAESRTFTLKPSRINDTYGQRIPGIPASQAVAAGESVDLIYIDNSGEFRTNFGIVDAGGAGVAYTLTAYDHNGSVLGTPYDGTVGANQWDQFNPLDKVGAGTQTNARVMFAVTSGMAMPYASQVDNASGDPIFIDGTKIKGGGGGSTGCVATGLFEGYSYLIEHEYADLMNAPFSAYVENDQLVGFPQFYFLWVGTKYYWSMYADDIYFDTPLPMVENVPFSVQVSFKWLNSSNAECLQQVATIEGVWDGCSFITDGTATLLVSYLATCGDPDWKDAAGKFYFTWKAGIDQTFVPPPAVRNSDSNLLKKSALVRK